MKRLLISLMLVLTSISAFSAKPKKTTQQLFPDGTPIDSWFLNHDATPLESLGTQYRLDHNGIISSTTLIQTEKIQAVIDKCAANGGGVVVVPEGIYKSGALFFKQGVHLWLSRGAVLLGSEEILDFTPVIMTRIEGELCKYFPALVNADGLDGFVIGGEGIIDGNGSTYWQHFRTRREWNPQCTNKDEQRPRLVHISNCKNVEMAGVTLQNSPFWSSHYYKCDHVKVLGVRIFSPVQPIRSASADGVDMDVCSNFHIYGCRITVNDDGICFKGGKGPYADQDPANGINENILVENCFFDHTTGCCMTCGSECIHVRNVIMRNCRAEDGGPMLNLKMRPDTPQRYEYITVEDFTGSCNALLGAKPWTQFFDLKGRKDIPRSFANNITIQRVDISCRNFMNHIPKEEEFELSDFIIRDVTVRAENTKFIEEGFKNSKFENMNVVEEKYRGR